MTRQYLFSVTILAIVLIPLGMAHASEGRSHANKGHQEHTQHPTTQTASLKGDAYPLGVDAATGKPLVAADHQVIVDHKGRELRFNSHKSADAFKANPAKYLPRVDQLIIADQLSYYPLSTCVVSGETLGGAMGDPIDVVYKNRLIRFCCKTCPKEFAKDPAKYLSKLDAAVIAKQSDSYPLETCIISGEKLESMKNPVQRVIANRLVKFCCPGCVKVFNKNLAKNLAKLDAARKNHDAHGDEH